MFGGWEGVTKDQAQTTAAATHTPTHKHNPLVTRDGGRLAGMPSPRSTGLSHLLLVEKIPNMKWYEICTLAACLTRKVCTNSVMVFVCPLFVVAERILRLIFIIWKYIIYVTLWACLGPGQETKIQKSRHILAVAKMYIFLLKFLPHFTMTWPRPGVRILVSGRAQQKLWRSWRSFRQNPQTDMQNIHWKLEVRRFSGETSTDCHMSIQHAPQDMVLNHEHHQWRCGLECIM